MAHIFQQSEPRGIATQGIANGHGNLHVATQGLIHGVSQEELTNLFIGGEALLSKAIHINADGYVVIQGAALYEFIDIDQFEHVATGGLVLQGAAEVYSNASKKERGGKGIVRPRSPVPFGGKPANVYNYIAEPAKNKQKIFIDDYFEKANASLKISGEAFSWFAQAKPNFEFLKNLPKPKKSEPIFTIDSKFRNLLRKIISRPQVTKPKPKIFHYISEGGLVTTHRDICSEYFNYSDFIIKEDEDLLLMEMIYMTDSPIVSVTASIGETLIRRDDADLEILLLS